MEINWFAMGFCIALSLNSAMLGNYGVALIQFMLAGLNFLVIYK